MGNVSEVTCWAAVWDTVNGKNYIGTRERVDNLSDGAAATR